MELLLEQTVLLTPEQEKSHISFPFTLTREYVRLHLHFSYAPKYVEDEALARQIIESAFQKYLPEEEASARSWRDHLPLPNLVTLSLDHGGEAVGCAHRHPNEQHIVISPAASTEGFLPHVPGPGVWRAVLSLHAVNLPVSCSLRAEGEASL